MPTASEVYLVSVFASKAKEPKDLAYVQFIAENNEHARAYVSFFEDIAGLRCSIQVIGEGELEEPTLVYIHPGLLELIEVNPDNSVTEEKSLGTENPIGQFSIGFGEPDQFAGV